MVIAVAFRRADRTSQFVERRDDIMWRNNDILGTRVLNLTAETKRFTTLIVWNAVRPRCRSCGSRRTSAIGPLRRFAAMQ